MRAEQPTLNGLNRSNHDHSNRKTRRAFCPYNASEATEILKATAFKGPATDAQMTALCVVAQQYGLNPFTRELYGVP